ncbi:MAG: adenylate/guanylate cyclase domain-containing protein [Actinobacteria bacterium]|nr:adenylate/guanylate cyclase domain-containing protein [Actinomycetota bacterium]
MARRRASKTLVDKGPPAAATDRHVAVLFADIIGCSEISNHKRLDQYNAFLAEFHAIFNEVAEQHRETWYEKHEQQYFQWSTRGDEGCLMIFIPGRENDIAEDVDTAINIALDLKRRWLLSQENKERIQAIGLLPEELAIGIHLGKAFINEDSDGFRPEGYAINLTKRVEGASREGHFTRIFVSEAAKGRLDLLSDEATYTFGPPRFIQAKGISRPICAFEVKHHFLPTDWSDLRELYPRTRALEFEPDEEQVQLVLQAHHENPTNLWVAEEYVLLKLMYEYRRLEKAGEANDVSKLRESYSEPENVLRRLSTGDHRDAGVLVIRGFIAGECQNYVTEQRLYQEALTLDDQYPEAHWYLAYSMSRQLYEELDAAGRVNDSYAEISDEEKERVRTTLQHYRCAVELNPFQSWMRFDLACELSRWADSKEEITEAVEMLSVAVRLNSAVRGEIADERYLDPIRSDPRVKKLLSGGA